MWKIVTHFRNLPVLEQKGKRRSGYEYDFDRSLNEMLWSQETLGVVMAELSI